jgi:hypothetical protein
MLEYNKNIPKFTSSELHVRAHAELDNEVQASVAKATEESAEEKNKKFQKVMSGLAQKGAEEADEDTQ